MYFHLMFYVRLVLGTLVIITCLLGDNFVELTRHPLLRAVCDNGVHAVIGAISGITFVIHFHDRLSNILGWILILICFITSSFIDLDHFIEARSLSLEIATSITHRPFLHCSTIPLVIFLTFVATSCLNYFKSSLILAMICIAFFTHHTRDACRRGFWFCPFGYTHKISYLLYIILTVLIPYIIFYTFMICKNLFIPNYMNGKEHDTKLSSSSAKYTIV